MGTEDAFRRLSGASLRLHPDDIHDLARELGATIGLDELVLFLVDFEQHVLVPLPFAGDGGADGRQPIAVDGTVGGRSYRTQQPVIAEGEAGSVLWLPLLDSAERFGVVRASIDPTSATPDRLDEWLAFVSLVGEIVANKQDHGDVVALTRRTAPLSVAAEMRWAMLPPLTFSGRNLAVSGVLLPAYAIAGDTFDYAVNGDVLHLVIIDAVGHGLEAARIANLAVSAYRAGRRAGASMLDTYRSMDELVALEFGEEKFATAQLATLELSTGRLRWLNAGHPAPMVIRNGRRVDLGSDIGLPVGLGGPDPVVNAESLEPDDVLLLFTDGITEARSVDGTEFGRERLADLTERAVAAGQPSAETVRLLSHAVLGHQVDVLQDDATLLLVSWTGPAPSGP